jgi:hypothetical protein
MIFSNLLVKILDMAVNIHDIANGSPYRFEIFACYLKSNYFFTRSVLFSKGTLKIHQVSAFLYKRK